MRRRTFLASGLAAAGAQRLVDTHIHLFDQTRPQGAPYWAGPKNKLPALPARYRRLAGPLGITGAIIVEASPWVEDNLWALQVAEGDPMMLGLVGNLEPDKPEFAEYLERYRKNRLFLGIRYGDLWGRRLSEAVERPAFVEGLKRLRDAGLVLDTANPSAGLLRAVVRLTDAVPGLRVVMDHVPAMALRGEGWAELAEVAKRPTVYAKVSAAMRVREGRGLVEAGLYKETFDRIWGLFGDERVLFGSDWPNSDAVDNLDIIVKIAKGYGAGLGAAAAERFYWRNAQAVYRWRG